MTKFYSVQVMLLASYDNHVTCVLLAHPFVGQSACGCITLTYKAMSGVALICPLAICLGLTKCPRPRPLVHDCEWFCGVLLFICTCLMMFVVL